MNANWDKIKAGLIDYQWLQENVKFDVTRGQRGKNFQKRYRKFYGLNAARKGAEWCAQYFALMQRAKKERLGFEDILDRLENQTKKIEASFASKLIATLDPEKPVIDQHVLRNFRLRKPPYNIKNRKEKWVKIYKQLSEKYAKLMTQNVGKHMCKQFDEKFLSPGITDLKKIDFVLWQIRPKTPPKA